MLCVNVVSVGLPPISADIDVCERQAERMARTLEHLAQYAPDVVCFPEICLHQNIPLKDAVELAQPVPGPATEQFAPYCRQLGSYVLLPLLESAEGRIYNAVVLMDDRGRIVGRYRKHYPTSYEMADGIYPGREIPVWNTPVGRIGIAVCFDLKFPEVALALTRGQAQIVFWPTMFNGGRRLLSWARDYGFHLISCGTWGGQVINPLGQVLASSKGSIELPGIGRVNLLQAELNVDCRTYHLDYNGPKLSQVAAKYGDGVKVSFLEDEAIVVLASLLRCRRVEEIEQEFGLEDLRSYLDRAIGDRERLLNECDD